LPDKPVERIPPAGTIFRFQESFFKEKALIPYFPAEISGFCSFCPLPKVLSVDITEKVTVGAQLGFEPVHIMGH